MFKAKWIIDYYLQKPQNQITESCSQLFTHQDLYHKDALKNLKDIRKKHHFLAVDCLIIDPPRSGLTTLNQVLQDFFPELAIYVSCQATSLKRDLESSFLDKIDSQYRIVELHLLDLFPGTHHFETLVILQRK